MTKSKVVPEPLQMVRLEFTDKTGNYALSMWTGTSFTDVGEIETGLAIEDLRVAFTKLIQEVRDAP
jgi:hypothetical protein